MTMQQEGKEKMEGEQAQEDKKIAEKQSEEENEDWQTAK